MSKLSIFIFSWAFCSLFLSALSQQQNFVYTKFSGSEGVGAGADADAGENYINLKGSVEIDGRGLLQLTKETKHIKGHAFYPTPLQFKDAVDGAAHSFSTAFVFAIVAEFPTLSGHGFAFVIAPSNELTGSLPSQYLGLFNATNVGDFANHVFAVEFDTVMNVEFDDINDNHVGIDINTLASSASATVAYYGDDGKMNELNLWGGHNIQAWVDYDGVGKVLNVTVCPCSSKPPRPLLSFPVDLSPILREQMFVGFSASTGMVASSHYILGWSFEMNGAAPSLNLTQLPPTLSQHKKKRSTISIIIGSVSAAPFLIGAIAVASFLFYRFKNADAIEPWELECGPHRFSYKELKHATKGFRDRELLGFGGFGKVYKGILPGSGAEVAVKRIFNESRQGIREFVAEIASIGRLRHRNLVQLQGWCRRRADLLLVYDYMPNGSLDKLLFSDESGSPRPLLTWAQRLRILRGVASALLYLHEEWEQVVIHRDVKASNVLLDAEFNGRLGDFGLAKIYEHGADPSTTRVAGTLGYLAPELTRTGKATTSSDVFSFGALALGVVCGRRPVESRAAPEEMILVDWVWEQWSAGRWEQVVDARLSLDYEREEVEIAIKIGLMCSHHSPAVRPTMRDVARYLDGSDAAEVPDVPSPPADLEGVGFDARAPSRHPDWSIAVGEERTVLETGSRGGGANWPHSVAAGPTKERATGSSSPGARTREDAGL